MVKWFQVEVSLPGNYLLIAYENRFKKLLQDFVLNDKIVKLSRGERVKPCSTFVLALVRLAPISSFLAVILDSHAFNPSSSASFLFWDYLHRTKLTAVTTAWDVFISWPAWCASFMPWISSDLKGRDIQSYCCLPDVLPTSVCLFSGQEVFRKLPIRLLLWKVTLKPLFFFGQTA